MGGTQLATRRGKHTFSRTSRSKTHIHIVFPRGWPSCFFFCFFFYRGGGAEGRGHETGFYVFPLSRFYFLGLIISPRPYWLCPGFSGFTLETTHFSSFFFLFDGPSKYLADPVPDRTSDRKNLEGTPSFPPLLTSKDPPLVRKENAPYTPVPLILFPSASQGRGKWDSGYGCLFPFSL